VIVIKGKLLLLFCSALFYHQALIEQVVDISHGVFHSRLKNSFLNVFPSIAIYPLLRLISWNLTTRCLTVNVGGSVGECGRLSWILTHYNIVILTGLFN